MGKIMHDPQIHHFSHPHILELNDVQNQQVIICAACQLQILSGAGGYIYTCKPCNFTLHLSCTQFPQLITHPSHPNHHLSLLPTSPYSGSGGLFNCDACSRQGTGFNYHCSYCDFDLHVLCASKPLSITHPFHSHPLSLTFAPPYVVAPNGAFSCDICRKLGSRQWLYRCLGCEFDVHLDCATATLPPPPLPPPQHHHSFPAGTSTTVPHHHNHYMHSASTGGIQNYPAAFAGPVNGTGDSLGNAVMTGIFEGAAQQLGQSLMQSMIGGGGDSGSGGGGDGGGDGDGGATDVVCDSSSYF